MLGKVVFFSFAIAGFSFAGISGYVQLPNAEPVSGAVVTQYSTGKTATTDASGYFLIEESTGFSIGAEASLSVFPQNAKVSLFSLQGRMIAEKTILLESEEMDLSRTFPKLPSGIYVAQIQRGTSTETFKLSKSARGGKVHLEKAVGKKALQKSLAGDSLGISFDGKTLVPQMVLADDDADLGVIRISRKTVSGSVPAQESAVSVSLVGSGGESFVLNANVDNENFSYAAVSDWMLYDANRTWTVSAVGSSGEGATNVSDAVQNVTLNLVATKSSSSVAESSSSSADTTRVSLDYAVSQWENSVYATESVYLSGVENALGISASEIANELNSSVFYYAVESDGSLNANITATGNAGNWYDANGDVTEYSASPAVFSEVDLSTLTANVGHYPGLAAGNVYTMRQSLIYVKSGAQVIQVTWTIRLSVVASVSSSSSFGQSSSSSAVVQSSSSVNSSSSVSSSSSAQSSSSQITLSDLQSSNSDLYKFVNWEWTYRLAANSTVYADDYRIESNTNLTPYQIVKNSGKLTFCVQWQTTKSLSSTRRDRMVKMLNQMINNWTKYLKNYDGWPYDSIPVSVHWGVLDENVVTDAASGEVITAGKTSVDQNSEWTTSVLVPDCDGSYDEFFAVVEGYTSYSTNMWGFADYGAGFWVSDEHVIASLDAGEYVVPHIVAHESGHNFGLPDFYNSCDFPDANFSPLTSSSYSGTYQPAMIMNSGSSSVVTDADYWLLRKIWTEIKSNMGY